VGVGVQILKASTDREIDAAFASLVQAQTGALFVGNDFLFNSRMEQVTALAARYAIPTMYAYREFVVAGYEPDRALPTDRTLRGSHS
jgi:putative ABC transport system substrate-binding protein